VYIKLILGHHSSLSLPQQAIGLAFIANEQMLIARRTWSEGKNDRDPKRTNADNKLLLFYPFNVEETELSAAASGLKELGGDLLGLDQAHAICAPGQIVEAKTTKRKRGNNKQSTTIRAVDKECLRPGVWLNDVHVNFWMSW
jgi:hypothetical protein